MKHTTKIIALSVASSLLLGSVGIAFAEDNVQVHNEVHATSTTGSTTDSHHPLKDLRNEIREEHASSTEDHDLLSSSTEARKARHAEEKLEIKTKLDARHQENVKHVIANRIKAHQEIINAQKNRIARITLVAGKIKAAGKDTSAADAKLVDASAKLTLATADLAAITTSASTTVSATNPGEKLNKMKTLFDTVNADIKAAHKDITEAIVALKALGNVEFHATSTASTSSHE
jgi:hypothetical protein